MSDTINKTFNTKNLAPEEISNVFASMTDFLFDQLPLPINFIDTEGRVIIMNQAFLDYAGLEKSEVIGRYLTDIDPTVRLPIVLKTGVAEVNKKHKFVTGKEGIVNRLPLYIDGKVVAAAGIVLFDDLAKLQNTILEKKSYKTYDVKKAEKIKENYKSKYNFDDIIAQSEEGQKCKNQAMVYADSDFYVLILGESGVGKELYAHSIHSASKRKDGPFVRVNCAALPETLIESELFGYDQGAFTGAVKGGKVGKFELAQGGTIFLDEIADIPLPLQVKLLRVLQEREIEKIGSNEIVPIDVRVIAATNCDLEARVKDGLFRADLFYRLNVLNLNVPSLRECSDDVGLLVKNFTTKLFQKYGLFKDFSEEVISILSNYQWTGNVRELRNIVERISVTAKHDIVQIEDLPQHIQNNSLPTISHSRLNDPVENWQEEGVSLKEELARMEKSIIKRALLESGGNKAKVCKKLKLSRMSLYRKIEEYGLQKL